MNSYESSVSSPSSRRPGACIYHDGQLRHPITVSALREGEKGEEPGCIVDSIRPLRQQIKHGGPGRSQHRQGRDQTQFLVDLPSNKKMMGGTLGGCRSTPATPPATVVRDRQLLPTNQVLAQSRNLFTKTRPTKYESGVRRRHRRGGHKIHLRAPPWVSKTTSYESGRAPSTSRRRQEPCRDLDITALLRVVSEAGMIKLSRPGRSVFFALASDRCSSSTTAVIADGATYRLG